MKLYHNGTLGHSHLARHFLALLSLEYDSIHMTPAEIERKETGFLGLNPLGEISTLVDGRLGLPPDPATLRRLERVEAIDGFEPMPSGDELGPDGTPHKLDLRCYFSGFAHGRDWKSAKTGQRSDRARNGRL
jgi:hypothetical protein